MGIKGLWDALDSQKVCRDLAEFVIREGFERREHRKYRIGIDLSVWYYSSMTPYAVGHANRGENPELATFVSKMMRLAKLPCAVIFVSDGSKRPPIKRGVRVVNNANRLYKSILLLIEAFGFEHHVAPAEAEAELAYMNFSGIIDAVLTSDSDAFLFGALTVIRNWNVKQEADSVRVYKSQANLAIRLDGGPITRESMVLFGLLMGGDYDKHGLPGCGTHISRVLSASVFGESLCASARTLTRPEFAQYLVGWREDVRHFLRTDPIKTLGSRHLALASSIPETFPNIDIVYLYLYPQTSSPEEIIGLGLNQCLPDVAEVARLCELYFEWAVPATILVKYEAGFFQAVVMSVLREEVVAREKAVFFSGLPELLVASGKELPSQFAIVNDLFPEAVFTIGKKITMRGLVYRQVGCSTQHLQNTVLLSLRGLRQVTNCHRSKKGKERQHLDDTSAITPSPFKMWVPVSVLVPLITCSAAANRVAGTNATMPTQDSIPDGNFEAVGWSRMSSPSPDWSGAIAMGDSKARDRARLLKADTPADDVEIISQSWTPTPPPDQLIAPSTASSLSIPLSGRTASQAIDLTQSDSEDL